MRTGVLLLVVASVAFAPAPFPRSGKQSSPRDDLSRMQGHWQVVEGWSNGRVYSSHTHITLEGNLWVFLREGKVNTRWEIGLDPTASPRALDFRVVGERDRVSIKAAYRFDGDTLRVVWAGSTVRPEAADLDGGRYALLVLRRTSR